MLRPRNLDSFAVGRVHISFSRLSLLSGHSWPFHYLLDRRLLPRRPMIRIKLPMRLITQVPRAQTLHSQVSTSWRPRPLLVQLRWILSRATARLQRLSITFEILT